jgi:hypothetical protein
MTTLLHSTGQVARRLRTTECRLAELVRRGRLRENPVVVAGRRLWTEEQILDAAALLRLAARDERAQSQEVEQ